MTVERALRLLAGTFVTAGTALAALHSPWWLALTGLVGLNLLQSGFTNWCPAVWVLERLGLERCAAASAGRTTSVTGTSAPVGASGG